MTEKQITKQLIKKCEEKEKECPDVNSSVYKKYKKELQKVLDKIK